MGGNAAKAHQLNHAGRWEPNSPTAREALICCRSIIALRTAALLGCYIPLFVTVLAQLAPCPGRYFMTFYLLDNEKFSREYPQPLFSDAQP